jgi:cytochrome c5
MKPQVSKAAAWRCGAAPLVLAFSVLALSLIAPARAAADPFPEGLGKAVFIKVCTQCHAAEPIATLRYNKDEWKELVFAMKGMGAEATDDECNVIIDYLARNFGKKEEQK